MAGLEGGEQISLVDDAAARTVDDAYARLHGGDLAGGDHVLGLVGEGHVHRDDVGLGEQALEVGEPHAQIARPALGNVRIVDEDLHLEGSKPRRHARAHLAEAEHARRLAEELGAVDAAVPPAPLEGVVGERDPPDQREQHADGMLRRRDDVAVRGVGHHDALARAGVDVDIVDADPRPPQDAELPRVRQELGGHRGGGAGDDGLVVGDPVIELLLGELARDLVHVEPALLEIGDPLGRDGVDDQQSHAAMLAWDPVPGPPGTPRRRARARTARITAATPGRLRACRKKARATDAFRAPALPAQALGGGSEGGEAPLRVSYRCRRRKRRKSRPSRSRRLIACRSPSISADSEMILRGRK